MQESGAIDDILQVEEVRDARFFAGDLFRARFKCDPPDFPMHLVAFYKAWRGSIVVLGYVHCIVDGDIGICGGLVEDARAVARLPLDHIARIEAAGGVEKILLRSAVNRLRHLPAVWARVGDVRVREQFFGAGFEPIDDPFILVQWNPATSGDDRPRHVELILQRGAF